MPELDSTPGSQIGISRDRQMWCKLALAHCLAQKSICAKSGPCHAVLGASSHGPAKASRGSRCTDDYLLLFGSEIMQESCCS